MQDILTVRGLTKQSFLVAEQGLISEIRRNVDSGRWPQSELSLRAALYEIETVLNNWDELSAPQVEKTQTQPAVSVHLPGKQPATRPFINPKKPNPSFPRRIDS
jgi:hypothetical protein